MLAAVDAAFSPAFAVTGAMALLAALLLRAARLRRDRVRSASALRWRWRSRPATRSPSAASSRSRSRSRDPCEDRERRSVGGVEGVAEDVALRGLDRAACRFGSSREELVLALFDDESRRAYEREHGVDPRSLDELLRAIVGLGTGSTR